MKPGDSLDFEMHDVEAPHKPSDHFMKLDGSPATDDTMKYYIFSYQRKIPPRNPIVFGQGRFASQSGLLALYSYAYDKGWCLTHVAEITEDEFAQAQARGIEE